MLAIHAPKPSGKWGIMRCSDVIMDEERKDPHCPSSCRKLALDIWLPVNQVTQLVPYDERAIKFWREATFWSEAQKIALEDQLDQFGQHLSADGIIESSLQSIPVVIFSHGFGAWAAFYSYIIEEIVSHGIAVVGINHTYHAGIATFPDQTIYGTMTHSDLFQSRYAAEEQATWLQDLQKVIQTIKKNDFPYGLMDPEQLVVMGQSFGGSLAMHACCKISGLRGCINLDGALFGHQEEMKTLSPLLILLGSESIQFMKNEQAIDHLSRHFEISLDQARDFQACYLDRLDHIVKSNPNVSKMILHEVDHLGFTDFVFLKNSRLFMEAAIGSKESDVTIFEIRKNVLDFLRAVLTQVPEKS